MSEEQLKAFLEKVKADTSLQERLKAAADSDAVLSIAKEVGFMVSVDDLKSSQSMTEEELEGMSGGAGYYMTGKTAECGPVACTCGKSPGACLTQ